MRSDKTARIFVKDIVLKGLKDERRLGYVDRFLKDDFKEVERLKKEVLDRDDHARENRKEWPYSLYRDYTRKSAEMRSQLFEIQDRDSYLIVGLDMGEISLPVLEDPLNENHVKFLRGACVSNPQKKGRRKEFA